MSTGYGIPVGRKPPLGDGDGKNLPPLLFAGTGTGIFLPRGDGYGDSTPDGEFPIAISKHEQANIQTSKYTNKYLVYWSEKRYMDW
jgi:hypothetical protein